MAAVRKALELQEEEKIFFGSEYTGVKKKSVFPVSGVPNNSMVFRSRVFFFQVSVIFQLHYSLWGISLGDCRGVFKDTDTSIAAQLL